MYVTEDLIVEMIIGRDFLKENRESIDLQRNKLKLKKSYIVRAPEKSTYQATSNNIFMVS